MYITAQNYQNNVLKGAKQQTCIMTSYLFARLVYFLFFPNGFLSFKHFLDFYSSIIFLLKLKPRHQGHQNYLKTKIPQITF